MYNINALKFNEECGTDKKGKMVEVVSGKNKGFIGKCVWSGYVSFNRSMRPIRRLKIVSSMGCEIFVNDSDAVILNSATRRNNSEILYIPKELLSL